MLVRYLLMMAALVAMPIGHAETAYVTDSLRLGLHREQDTSDQAFANLVSGTELEVLQRIPNYAEVETSDGQRGWVRSVFLVTEKPAQLIVEETIAELEAVRQELTAATAARDSAQREVSRLSSGAAEQNGSVGNNEQESSRLSDENAEYAELLETYRGSIPIAWVVAAIGLSLTIGFLAGLWSLDRYVRRRHGGFRLY